MYFPSNQKGTSICENFFFAPKRHQNFSHLFHPPFLPTYLPSSLSLSLALLIYESNAMKSSIGRVSSRARRGRYLVATPSQKRHRNQSSPVVLSPICRALRLICSVVNGNIVTRPQPFRLIRCSVPKVTRVCSPQGERNFLDNIRLNAFLCSKYWVPKNNN